MNFANRGHDRNSAVHVAKDVLGHVERSLSVGIILVSP